MKKIFEFYLVIAILSLVSFSPVMAQRSGESGAKGQENEQSETQFQGAVAEVYKTIDGAELKAWVFKPKSAVKSQKLPAAIFFFGGGWRGGNPKQFVPHCEYLARRGMIGIVVDYRVSSRYPVKITDCGCKICCEVGASPFRASRN